MLALSNPGEFKAKAVPLADANGTAALVVVVRGTFDFQGRLRAKDEQTAIVEADEFWGDPDGSSLKAAADVSLEKKGTDVLLKGHAQASASSGRRKGEVVLSVGSLKKQARVSGERVWNKRWFGMEISQPKPFETVPLLWERTYGGTLPAGGAAGGVLVEAQNPVGMGLWSRDAGKPQDGLALPQIEAPEALVKGWKDKSRPCGFGPVARHWQPRLGFAGTYDEAWRKGRAPAFPKDFDQRFLNVASPDQVTAEPLLGGEPVEVDGVSAAGPVRFALPRWRQTVKCRFANREEEKPAKISTVAIDADEARLVLVWSAQFSCDREMLLLREVVLDSKIF